MHKTILFSLMCGCGATVLLAQTAPSAPTYTISTVAGSGTAGFAGDGSAATSAELYLPSGVAFVGGNLYIVDQVNHRVRFVSGGNIKTIAGNGTAGYSGDNGQATSAELFDPVGVVVDGQGNVYISDTRNEVIRKISASGTITTYAGNNNAGAGITGDGGGATNAQLNGPGGLALDSAGNLYIADVQSNKIRLVSAATGNNISTFAGDLTPDFLGDGGPASKAELNNPQGVAIDSAGNVYIADTANNRIREVTTDGIIHTVAGNGLPGHSGDGGQAVNASLNHPAGVAVDAAGNLYIADTFNQRIRMVLTNGVIVTIAGSGGQGFVGDGGPALQAGMNFPAALTVDSNGNVYVCDSQNYVVRMLTPSAKPGGLGTPSVSQVQNASGYGGGGTAAQGSWIEIKGTNLAADTRSWGGNDFVNSFAPTALDRTSVTVGGVPAYIYFVSTGQVNALLSANTPTGSQAVIVRNAAGASTAVNINVAATQAGIYAPAQLLIGGKQYAGAVYLDNQTFVAPVGAASGGLATRPAKAGDTVTLYGIGFGGVFPGVTDGQIVAFQNNLLAPVVITIGGAQVMNYEYMGLAPGSLGLYQFTFDIPPGTPPGNLQPLIISQNGVPLSQTLYTAIGN